MLKNNKGVLRKPDTKVYIFVHNNRTHYEDLYIIPSSSISIKHYLDQKRNRFPDTEANIKYVNTTRYIQLK